MYHVIDFLDKQENHNNTQLQYHKMQNTLIGGGAED